MTEKPVILGFELVPLDRLEPHPDAESFGASAEDRAALAGSLSDAGLLDPLSVAVQPGEAPLLPGADAPSAPQRYWVLDGCGRLEALRHAAATTVAPCIVWDLRGLSVREFAVQRNTMGRRVTTGQRLLCYLSLHEKAALEAAERAAGNQHDLMSSRDDINRRNLSARLGCSSKDATAALALFAAERAGEAGAREAYEGVLRGETPIRRWRAAAAGRAATAGRAKAPTDFGSLALRTFTSLRTVFEGWYQIEPSAREAKYKKASEAFAALPEELSMLALRVIAEQASSSPRLAEELRRLARGN